jgi:hypothetical protein
MVLPLPLALVQWPMVPEAHLCQMEDHPGFAQQVLIVPLVLVQ